VAVENSSAPPGRPSWWRRIVNNQWTITIVGGAFAGVIATLILIALT
jgi:hypothetical protein